MMSRLRLTTAQLCAVTLLAASVRASWTRPDDHTPGVSDSEPGYFTVYTFNGDGCADAEVMAARAYLTGRCIRSGDSSFMYTCDEEGLGAVMYSDIACEHEDRKISVTDIATDSCSNKASPTSSTLAVCEPTIRYGLEEQSVVKIYESESSCEDESQVSQMKFYVANTCFSTTDYSFYYGCDGSELTQKQYESGGCDSASEIVDGVMYDIGVCTAAGNGTSYEAVCGSTPAPTPAPTPSPTPSPAHNDDDDDDAGLIAGLTPGAFTGAVFGSLVFVGVIIGLIYHVKTSKARRARQQPRLSQPLLDDPMSI